MFFPVATASARRVSELEALSAEPQYCTFQQDKVVLRTNAVFIPTVNLVFHRRKSFHLSVSIQVILLKIMAYTVCQETTADLN